MHGEYSKKNNVEKKIAFNFFLTRSVRQWKSFVFLFKHQ